MTRWRFIQLVWRSQTTVFPRDTIWLVPLVVYGCTLTLVWLLTSLVLACGLTGAVGRVLVALGLLAAVFVPCELAFYRYTQRPIRPFLAASSSACLIGFVVAVLADTLFLKTALKPDELLGSWTFRIQAAVPTAFVGYFAVVAHCLVRGERAFQEMERTASTPPTRSVPATRTSQPPAVRGPGGAVVGVVNHVLDEIVDVLSSTSGLDGALLQTAVRLRTQAAQRNLAEVSGLAAAVRREALAHMRDQVEYQELTLRLAQLEEQLRQLRPETAEERQQAHQQISDDENAKLETERILADADVARAKEYEKQRQRIHAEFPFDDETRDHLLQKLKAWFEGGGSQPSGGEENG